MKPIFTCDGSTLSCTHKHESRHYPMVFHTVQIWPCSSVIGSSRSVWRERSVNRVLCLQRASPLVIVKHSEKHSRNSKTSVYTDHNSDDSAAHSATSPALFLIHGVTVSFGRLFKISIHLSSLRFLVFMNVVLHSLGVAALRMAAVILSNSATCASYLDLTSKGQHWGKSHFSIQSLVQPVYLPEGWSLLAECASR